MSEEAAQESLSGRLMVVITLVVLFGLPVWAVLTAGIIQVFPEVVGYFPGERVVQIDGGAIITETDARPSMQNWAISGAISLVVVLVMTSLFAAVGGFQRFVAARARGTRRDLRRYEALAGDVVLEGATFQTRSRTTQAVPAPVPAVAAPGAGSPGLRAAYERGFVATTARQFAFGASVGSRWNIDVREGTLDLGNRVVPLHLLGTTDPSQTEWLWGWAPQEMAFPDAILERARALRGQDIPEFQEATWGLDGPRQHMLFIAQSHLAGLPTFWGKGPTGPGIQCLVDEPVSVEPMHLIKAIMALTMAQPVIADHATAIRSAAEVLGLDLREDGDDWQLQLPTGTVSVEFREGRVASVSGGLRGAARTDEPL